MPEWSEPGRRWRLLVPAGATVVDAGATVPADLPSGATVVLAGPRRRVRALVRGSGLAVEAEYLALPSLSGAVVLTRAGGLPWTARAVLTVPPGVTRLQVAWSAAIAVVRAFPVLLGVVARDRVVVGRQR